MFSLEGLTRQILETPRTTHNRVAAYLIVKLCSRAPDVLGISYTSCNSCESVLGGILAKSKATKLHSPTRSTVVRPIQLSQPFDQLANTSKQRCANRARMQAAHVDCGAAVLFRRFKLEGAFPCGTHSASPSCPTGKLHTAALVSPVPAQDTWRMEGKRLSLIRVWSQNSSNCTIREGFILDA